MNNINDLNATEERAYQAHMNALAAVSQAYHEHDPDLRLYMDAVDRTRKAWSDAVRARMESKR